MDVIQWQVQRVLMACAALLISISATLAQPWAEPGDARLRHDLQLLRNAGVLDMPLSTWPVPWPDVDRALRNAGPTNYLTPHEAAALARIRRSLRLESQPNRVKKQSIAGFTQSSERMRQFQASPRARLEGGVAFDWMGSELALKVQVLGIRTVGDDAPDDDHTARLDGSYIGYVFDDWSINAGVIPQWWGPGVDGSLILSNNTRPLPALYFRRTTSQPFSDSWLSWLGNWNLAMFVGQLESGRGVPDALMFGARFTFMPDESLEVGLSRVAQFGGNRGSADADAFWRMLVRNKKDGAAINDMAAADFSWNVRAEHLDINFYGQFTLDTLDGSIFENLAYLGGLSFSFPVDRYGLTLGFEYVDTTANINGFYESTSFSTGYRYYGRSLGHSIDNDSRMLSFHSSLIAPNGIMAGLALRIGELNIDGVGQHSLSPNNDATFSRVDSTLTFSGDRGQFAIGAGLVKWEGVDNNELDAKFYLNWRSELEW